MEDGILYQRIVTVGPVGDGADWRANGAVLRHTLAGIAASAADRCLLALAAGVYDLGAKPLHMQVYVDIVGAGEQLTRLTSEVCAPNSGTLVGADHATLRHLTIANTGGGEFAVAIFNDGVAPQLNSVTVEASGGIANYGVYNCNGAAPSMTHLRVLAAGRRCNIGVYNDGASPTMQDVHVVAAGGHVGYGIYNHDSASPTMTRVRATAAGSDRTIGIYNDQGTSSVMNDVAAQALGGIDNIDVYNG
jgi:hypothetical protein